MFDNFKLLNYSNSLVSPELYARHMSRLFPGSIVDGLLVIPNTGLIVTLPTGNGFIPYGSGATASNREFSLVADFDITLDTADASNPRIDLIVIYVDLAVALPGGTPTAANLDGPGVVKATFVKGTPNASPVDPTVGAIQTKIGASNPYIIVAAVRVDALVTTIAANKITDRRALARLAEIGGAWKSWTPTFTNLGGGTLSYAKYSQIGKTIRFRILYTLTGANVSGAVTFTPPVAIGSYDGTLSGVEPIGNVVFRDAGTALIPGATLIDSPTQLQIRATNAASTYATFAALSSTVPFTWANTDAIAIEGTYEAA